MTKVISHKDFIRDAFGMPAHTKVQEQKDV
jgi:hypothetical protein